MKVIAMKKTKWYEILSIILLCIIFSPVILFVLIIVFFQKVVPAPFEYRKYKKSKYYSYYKKKYKIGITRRTVEERMKELGSGASHSFPMNVHGYVYCDDCFQVEAALHKHFSAKRVNQVNPKKEWFFSTLDEIQKAFKDVCNIDIELVDAVDESYLYSQERLNA